MYNNLDGAAPLDRIEIRQVAPLDRIEIRQVAPLDRIEIRQVAQAAQAHGLTDCTNNKYVLYSIRRM